MGSKVGNKTLFDERRVECEQSNVLRFGPECGLFDGVELCHVSKIIRKRTVLDDVCVKLPRGGIYGFYGANGSGKTMLFRAICGLISVSRGDVFVFGQRLGEKVSSPDSLGVVIESTGLWDDYSGIDNLRMLASIKRTIGDAEIVRALERVGLNPEDRRAFKRYSLGMKQRLGIAQAIMEYPELLVLDEPMNALDEDGRALICDVIAQERQRGATVLVASHEWDELGSLCDQRFEMHDGRLREGR